MQCPYRNFQDCLLEKCPACVFEEIKSSTTRGRKPDWLSYEAAEQKGMIWKETHTSYKFISCRLVDNNVAPSPAIKEEKIVNNVSSSVTMIKRSIF